MITSKALHKARVLIFWEKHGLKATLDAFKIKRRTLFYWKKQFYQGNKKSEALNEKSKAPRLKRKRIWSKDLVIEIQQLRKEHPNLGKDKIYPLLQRFCLARDISYLKSSTIGRLMADMGGLRTYPQKISHFGKIKHIKRLKKLRKPKDFKVEYPGHLVAFDTITKYVSGLKRYVITFEDICTRFSFAWAVKSHASLAAKEFFTHCIKVFPFPFNFVLTDNGSEFAKKFAQELNRLHIAHYHIYPKKPQMNSHLERFNHTIQEEFIDYHSYDLLEPDIFNRKLIDWLLWYNTERPHWAFQNELSPVEYILSLKAQTNQLLNSSQKCNLPWTYTES
ncbi:MAG: integrase core domain-containing protein [Candidatus Parcubacteria bacterium]|nr:integrase core domain-containing protein [Candidatus Parcubacteria bacterium]